MIKLNQEWLQTNGKYKCPFCEIEKTKKGICSHIWLMHTNNGKDHREKDFNYSPWNKGLNKENDERIKLMSKKTSETLSGREGHKHTEKTKDKIFKSRIEFLEKNPDKVPYRLNHSSKMSYPEKIFKNALESYKISGWEYNYQHGIYSYDFAFPELKIDVEIDGATHETEKVKKIDQRRDLFSSTNGWKVIRFTAKNVKENVTSCIEKLKEFL